VALLFGAAAAAAAGAEAHWLRARALAELHFTADQAARLVLARPTERRGLLPAVVAAAQAARRAAMAAMALAVRLS
jgi:hypothetical protein